jgi:autotransporter-associated beta strand protein
MAGHSARMALSRNARVVKVLCRIAALLALLPAARETLAQPWNGNVSSDWNSTNNWDAGFVPNGPGAAAYFNLSGAPPNQPSLMQDRTLTTIYFNGRTGIAIGASTNTLTFDPNTSSAGNVIYCYGPGGFLYLSSLQFLCDVIFGGPAGTNVIVGDKAVVFNRTVTINRPLVINHPSTAVTFGSGTPPVPALAGSAPIVLQDVYVAAFNAGSVPSTYSGTITIQNGTMQLTPFALGPAANIVVGDTSGSATLHLYGNGHASNTVVVAGGSTGNHKLYFQGSPFCGLEGTLTLGSGGMGKDLSVQNLTDQTQELNSAITDPPGLAGTPGNLNLRAYSIYPLRFGGSGNSTHTGTNWILDGVLEMGKTGGAQAFGPGFTSVGIGTTLQHQSGVFSEQINDLAMLQVDGTYDLKGAFETIGALNGGGSVLLGTGQLSVGMKTNSAFDGIVSGTGRLRKVGAGTSLTLTRSNNFTGGTVIDGGRLLVNNTNGSATGTGNVWVNNSGFLSGTGRIVPAGGNSVVVTNGGTLGPGTNAGTLSLIFSGGGKLQLLAGSRLDVSVGSSAQIGVAVNNLEVSGALKLTAKGSVNNGLQLVLTNVPSHTGTFSQVIAPVGFGVQSHGWTNNDYFVVLRSPTLWENWHQQYWGAEYLLDPLAGDLSDPDGDSVANLLEYACNLNPVLSDRQFLTPTTGQAGLPNARVGTGPEAQRLVVEYVRRKASTTPELTYDVLFATDLGGPWAVNTNATTSVTSIDANWERVKVVDSITSPSVSRRFVTTSVRHTP